MLAKLALDHWRVWANRAALVGLAAMMVGLALGPSGCGRCDCGPPPEPIELGLFEITNSSEDRPELVGGMVDVSDEGVEISFTDDDGNSWVIDYSIASKW